MPEKVVKRTKTETTSKTKKDNKTINVFKITGNFRKGKRFQNFTKEIIGKNKQEAEEYIYSIMGSKHHVKRREISISKIEKIPVDSVTDPIIKQMIGG